MILKRVLLAAALFACVPPTMAGAAAVQTDPPVIVVPSGPAPVVPSDVVVLLANDPLTCLNGGEFVRYAGVNGDAAGFVCGRNGPELFTLFPMTNIELVRLILGPYAPKFISTIIPRETGHTWKPEAIDQGYARHLINRYDCHQLTQLCSKQAQARQLGYTWDETNYALPALLITRMLIDDAVAHHKDPYSDWRCSRCSLR